MKTAHNNEPRYIPMCSCGEEIHEKRYALGYKLCLWCGEEAAHQARRLWCVVPLHKSNYILSTDRNDLVGINNKGGLVR